MADQIPEVHLNFNRALGTASYTIEHIPHEGYHWQVTVTTNARTGHRLTGWSARWVATDGRSHVDGRSGLEGPEGGQFVFYTLSGNYYFSDVYIDIEFDRFGGYAYLVVETMVREGQGQTTPEYREIAFNPATTTKVTVTISADPAPGYKFVKWVNDVGSDVSTSSTVNMRINVSGAQVGDVGYRAYYAVFAVRDYAWRLDNAEFFTTPDSASGRVSSGFKSTRQDQTTVKNVRLRYNGTLYNRDGTVAYSGYSVFAYVRGSPLRYTVGGQITARVEITDRALWDLLGLRVLGWRIVELNPSGSTWALPDDNGSVSFSATHVPSRSTANGYEVYVLIGTEDVHKLTFSSKPDDAASLKIRARSYAGNREPAAEGVGVCSVYAAAGDLLELAVMGMLSPTRRLIHGWSESLPDRSDKTPGALVSKDFTMPDADAEVVVYFCSHKLLYEPSQDRLLYGAALKLLYDCSVPPGTTVYP